MEHKLIKITGEQIEYVDGHGTHHHTTVDDLICDNAIPCFNTADTHQILKCSRSDSGEFTLDRSGRLLWTPRALRPVWITLIAFFVACMVMTVMCESRIVFVEWFGHSTPLFGSILFFPFAFALSDIMNELFGYRATRQVIVITSIVLICAGLTFKWTLMMPGFFRGQNEAAYLDIFSIFPNAFVMHGIALFFGDLANARLFAYLRGLLVNRYLWFRSFVSTFISQFIYTSICTTLAYLYNYHPTLTISELVDLALSNHVVRMGIALAGLPLIYAVVKWAYWWGRQKTIAVKLEQLNRQSSST